ncbi:HDOD domain-containing protein [Alishewanella tabrizica]|uniref:Response regulator n=1 Tax=Alishewanella tabrizica TaxID=671278 RepID=A0ABQ2WKV5_9ALTE|nr:HDOD domain-containing protein [Alishewanella tabrizica]GGW56948.1 response regulator [Alishewanella tabrizica]
MNYRVLFIDDDAFMLKALLRTARRIRPNWQFMGCDQARDWLSVVADNAIPDIIICDYQMPDVNGEQVLLEAITHYPSAVRVLLTGDTSEQIVTRACEFSHHLLGKPFSEQHLTAIFECVERLQQLPFTSHSRAQLGQLQSLPVLPEFVKSIKQALQAPEVDLTYVAKLLQHEPALAAKLMQIANSAFMGFTRPVSTILDATLRLGSNLIEAIVTLTSMDKYFAYKMQAEAHDEITQFAYEHAVLAKKLAQYAGFTLLEQDTVFSAAIFSAIGRLIELLQQHENGLNQPPLLMQSGFLNSTLISTYILTLWNHSETVCNVVLWQDTPSPEGNTLENLSFILFLTKQLLLNTGAEHAIQLAEIIESPELLAAFQRLLSERLSVSGAANNAGKP